MTIWRLSFRRLNFLCQTQDPGNNDDGQLSEVPCHDTLVRTWTWARVRFVFLAMLLCQAQGYAQLGPQPPCGKEPVPALSCSG